jgi:hypothetical protein
MKTILDGTSRRVGAIFNEIDVNFIEVCNALIRIAYPEKTMIGYAETEPVAPAANDCYLVKETATVWTLEVEKNDIISWDGAAWEVLGYKITEISAAMRSSDSHIERGKFVYHEQTPGQYADEDNFYTQKCTVGNAIQGSGTWATKFTFIS